MSEYQDYGRYEFKYVLPRSARDEVLRIIGDDTVPDPHASAREDGLVGYYNHSIYLDTEDLHDYHERLSMRRVRNRLRVRYYGKPGDRTPVFLENKRKIDEWVVKQRVLVCDADAWAGHPQHRPWVDFARRVNGRGRYAAAHFLRLAESGRVPVSAVRYFREVYLDRCTTRLGCARLTIDREICSRTQPDGRDLYSEPDIELMPLDWIVMELKFCGDRPAWMRAVCSELGLRAQPVTKFGLSVVRGLRVTHRREQEALLHWPIDQTGWAA